MYPEFKSLLDKHDIVCLTETKLDDVDEINCDNFIFHYKNRKKLANHKSGGIALGFKKYLDKYIKYIQSDCQFVLWFSIDKKVLDLPKDAIFGIIYIPPINTSYTSEDAFTEIEFELQNFCSKTNYITMLGDFNSRTGNLSDFYNIDKDSSFENNFTDYNELSDVDVLDELGIPRLRNSIDTVVNGYGRKFIDFCKNNRMFILNGRLEENKTGSPTSRNSSVIDYALSSTHFLYNICKLEVLNFCKLFSDVHSPLSLQLYTNNEINDKLLTEIFCCGDERVNKWENEKCNEYKNNIDRNKVDDICNRLSAYVNDVNNVTKYDMNNIVTDICDTLTESAKATFGTSTFNKTMFKCSKNQFSKDWYNKDCKKAQREFRKSQRLYKHYGSNIFKERLRQNLNKEIHTFWIVNDTAKVFWAQPGVYINITDNISGTYCKWTEEQGSLLVNDQAKQRQLTSFPEIQTMLTSGEEVGLVVNITECQCAACKGNCYHGILGDTIRGFKIAKDSSIHFSTSMITIFPVAMNFIQLTTSVRVDTNNTATFITRHLDSSTFEQDYIDIMSCPIHSGSSIGRGAKFYVN
ncbi:unnamed protein product [Mytilus edulis]|uniref:Endonuclease/exonuclease/phosphatase domain-containing protein n=1 Tax=Mytilus edulis TaxID=6550 RepID=A0A8S3PS39_MYTED|nr:unnamed protein product [Mytilus edulis]